MTKRGAWGVDDFHPTYIYMNAYIFKGEVASDELLIRYSIKKDLFCHAICFAVHFLVYFQRYRGAHLGREFTLSEMAN